MGTKTGPLEVGAGSAAVVEENGSKAAGVLVCAKVVGAPSNNTTIVKIMMILTGQFFILEIDLLNTVDTLTHSLKKTSLTRRVIFDTA